MSALVRQYSPAPQLDESTEVHVPRFELRHLSEEGVRWLQAQQRDIPKGNPANVALDRALSQRLAGMQGGVPPAGAGHGEQDDGSSDGDDFEDDDDGDDDDDDDDDDEGLAANIYELDESLGEYWRRTFGLMVYHSFPVAVFAMAFTELGWGAHHQQLAYVPCESTL
jgi:hypothetical protein